MTNNSADLKGLKAKRSQLRARLTRCATFINQYDDTVPVSQVESRLNSVVSLLDEFNAVQLEIELLDATEADLKAYDDFENSYFQLVSKARDLLDAAKGNRNVINNTTPVQTINKIKLPEVELPSFTGRYDEWMSFHGAFRTMIDDNPQIPIIQKLQYLKSAIKGEAANVIRCLEITEPNYQVALQLLRERYENEKYIVATHVKALFELPVVSKESTRALRHLLDGATQHLQALASLKRPVAYWDDLLIHLMANKLDLSTRREWETRNASTAIPTFAALRDFLTYKCHALESLPNFNHSINPSERKPWKPFRNVVASTVARPTSKCAFCNGQHNLFRCSTFSNLTVSRRYEELQAKHLCFNCVQPGHMVTNCKAGNCKICNGRHHTLLHEDREAPPIAVTTCHTDQVPAPVLLATCLVRISDSKGGNHIARVLLDSGSQISLMTNRTARQLGLSRRAANMSLTGVGLRSAKIESFVSTTIGSLHNSFQAKINFFLIDTITSELPSQSFSSELIHVPRNLRLADSKYNQSREVDLLIGAELFYKLLCVGQFQTNHRDIMFHKTQLGWIISGALPTPVLTRARTCHLSMTTQLNENVRRFWEIESPTEVTIKFSRENASCVEHFNTTTTRDTDGRFTVALPWKHNADALGQSYQFAKKRFTSLEMRLQRDANLKSQYHEFIREYIRLGHMRQVDSSADNEHTGYFVPHHAVIKETSLTSRLRVVFDFSAKTTSGVSENDLLMVGPTLQDDLFSILLRFRTFQHVITADVTKMYRQIKIHPEDAKYQKILWRFTPDEPINTYELLTVTYGAASSSFQAINCLQTLAHLNRDKFPRGAASVLSDFYVDDLLSGADTLEDARIIRDEVRSVLEDGCFQLRKWSSNDESLIQDVQGEQDHLVLRGDEANPIKALGVRWCPRSDCIEYVSHIPKNDAKRVTKRNILSIISSIFDPLGLLGPVIIAAKILMQQLWKLNLSWDETVPLEMYTIWKQYLEQIQSLNYSIPRKTIINKDATLELHGFCDASTEAYGACIYLKSTGTDMITSCMLICAKSRVAPLKTVNLPRLELCAAVLLARLAEKVQQAIKRSFRSRTFYSDSKIALAWIRADPSRFSTFVSNRIGEIQTSTLAEEWRYVKTDENPADLISRGCTPSGLLDRSMWWHGPHWICNEAGEQSLPDHNDLITLPETREERSMCHTNVASLDLLNRFSSLTTALRVTAWMYRFIYNSRPGNEKSNGSLRVSELDNARIILTRLTQSEQFPSELADLKRHGRVCNSSRLLPLNPFLDKFEIIRVGGRLQHSALHQNAKHPAVLLASHALVQLIIRHEHIKNLHAGEQSTLAAIRMRFWIVSARGAVRKVLRKCVTCFKMRPRETGPIMGDLPACRTTQARPFSKTGVDFCGPFFVKEGSRRSKRTTRSYAALFVCMVTKAVHLELVSDLTTQAFIAALRRFISRRGLVTDIYSDNATNFRGTKNELAQLYKMLNTQPDPNQISNELSSRGVQWHFIPPRSPHFGGIWESNIKVAKSHLRRVAGNASFSYEELYTLLTQIEYVMNSRPLTPMSNDPNDLSYLTPGHFLVGDNLRSIPDVDLGSICTNRLSRWQRIQQVYQHFWARWHKEYLTELQRRAKWKTSTGTSVAPGQLVLIREDNVPPGQWKLARVIEVHMGPDGMVRAATVQSQRETYTRGVRRLCVLPIDTCSE